MSVAVGVISDTHGLLRPEALTALTGVAHIIHAGDIDKAYVLDELRRLAPVTVVRGNCDHGDWANELPRETVVELGGCTIAVIHNIHDLSMDARAAGLSVVVSGHSHMPVCEKRDGVLYMNPGSAGPRRWGKPVSLGRLEIEPGDVHGWIVTLQNPG
jgi:putative phosphoesterase